MPGQAGQFFREFGLTVAVAVLFSLVVARLLTPLMAAYLLKPLGGTKKAEERELDPRYATALAWALGHRRATAGLGSSSEERRVGKRGDSSGVIRGLHDTQKKK